MTPSPGRRFREAFERAASTSSIGGSAVLRDLAEMARACTTGKNNAIDAVAFAMSTILEQHANDLEDRPVTGDDTYALMSAGYDDLADGAKFLEKGGTAELAVEIVTALARLEPASLYRH